MKFVLIVYIFYVFFVNSSTTQILSPKLSKKKQTEKIYGLKEYEDAIYQYDDYPDELSLGHQMDLGRLIDHYDIPEDCFEELISIYEYYDTDEPEQNYQKKNPNNFQVHDLGEEEFLKVELGTDESRDIQSVIVKQQEKEQIQPIQNNDKKNKSKKKQSHINFRKKHQI